MKIILYLILLLTPTYSLAEDIAKTNPDKNKPIEITADKTLEWHRDDLQFIATGKTIAKQGGTEIHSEILTADYKDGAKGKIDIWRLTAADNVKMKSKNTTAYGQNLVYDVDKSVAVMTGNNLKLTSKDQVITSSTSMEYWVAEGIFTANGNAKAVRFDDILEADTIIANFTKDKNGKRVLNKMEAVNNVIITTPTETITGDHATYSAKTNKATLTGNVKIKNGKNTLQGNRAEIDMTANISKIFGSPTNNGRVKGIFYPSQKK